MNDTNHIGLVIPTHIIRQAMKTRYANLRASIEQFLIGGFVILQQMDQYFADEDNLLRLGFF